MPLFGLLEFAQRDHVGHRTAGVRVGHQDGPVGVDEFGGLGHEADAAQNDHVGLDLGGLACHGERIADDVGYILDLRYLVIVREDHRAALPAQTVDLLDQFGPAGPLKRYHFRAPLGPHDVAREP